MASRSKTKLDRKLSGYTPLGPKDNTKEFLSIFFDVLHLFPGGQNNLTEDVSKCANDEKLRQLVQSLRTGLLIPMKSQGGKTPTEVTPNPRPGVEDSIEDLKGQNIEPISRSAQAQLRRRCLERDGNKCVATGQYSTSDPHPQGAITTYLEAAHIIPFALGAFQAADSQAVDRHAKIWTNLRRYFPVLRSMSFTSEQINLEKNVLMLDAILHKEFGQFNLIFEATGVPNRYKVTTFPAAATGPIRNLPPDRIVEFRAHKGNWKLPDPTLLKIHVAIGHILQLTGQGEIIDKLLRDFENCGGLAPSGSTNIEDLLAASSLSLLPSNRNRTLESQKSPEKQRPAENQERPRGKSFDTENKPWGY